MIRPVPVSLLGLCATIVFGCVPPQYPSYGYNTPPPAQAARAAPTPAPSPTVVATMAPVPPVAPESSLLALAPLNLPIHEEWSSARCPDLALTFSGRSQAARSALSDTASFQETRQYHEDNYYEVAECFCTKGGDLSQTTKSAAEAVMAQTAQQYSDAAHMRILGNYFVEASPLGKYSEIDAAPVAESKEAVTMRIYWHGQCSVRLETMATPETKLRAAEFMGSLHPVKDAGLQPPDAAQAAGPADADGAAKPDAAAPAAGTAASATLPSGTVINPAPPAAAAAPVLGKANDAAPPAAAPVTTP
jgi:hypothetical protein